MRGYFGIGIEGGKYPKNAGGLWRTAHSFGAAFGVTIGARYVKQRCDTTRMERHVPVFEYDDTGAFLLHALPRDCRLVAVECGQGDPRPLPTFAHPERAIYVLGAEDHGLSQDLLDACDLQVEIPGEHCLNVATAGSIVLYDRLAKAAA
jgi:tRNA G18 (ribose-2'-O)-methylase SpoU